MKRFLVFGLFLFGFHFLFSQVQEIDSIKKLFRQSVLDSINLEHAISLSNLYATVSPDSAIYYGKMAKKMASGINNREKYCKSLILIGVGYYRKSDYRKADSLLLLGYGLAKELNHKLFMANASLNRGLVYMSQSKYLEAVEVYKESLELYEELDRPKDMAAINVNLGVIYYYQQNIEQALHYHLNALEKLDTMDVYSRRRVSVILSNVGGLYSEFGNPDSALLYTHKALELNRRMGNKKGMASNYNNLAEIEMKRDNPVKAREYFLRSFDLKEELGDIKAMIVTTNNLGQMEILEKRFDKAIEYFEKSKQYAEKVDEIEVLSHTHHLLADAYDSLGKYEQAYTNHKMYHQYFDTLSQNANDNKLLELQTKYETENKEKQIEILNKEKLLKDVQIKKNRIISILTGSSLFLFILFSVYLIRTLNQRKRMNELLEIKNAELREQKEYIEQKNHELGQQNEEIAAQRDEIEDQRKLVTEQKDTLAKQNEDILASITYAKKIQSAMLPPESYIAELLHENFIFYKPRDIVSGDFYWIKQVKEYIILVAADCTGHGVPGAFMSLLGISYLNEIVQKREITQANEVLNELRKQIKHSLRQHGQRKESKDGMDIALCAINTKNNKMQFAGAYNPLYLIRDVNGKPDLQEIKADRMPVGFYLGKDKSFTNHEIQLEMGDTFYIFSDGFMSQPGGKTNRKYMSENFKNLLLKIHDTPLYHQKELLERELNEWIAGHEQMDDILVVGVRV